MKQTALIFGFGVVLASSALACSSSSSGTPQGGPTDSGPADHTTTNDGPAGNPNNCVQPGYLGNEKGIGAYCVPGQSIYGTGANTSECPQIDGGPPLICSGDVDTMHP